MAYNKQHALFTKKYPQKHIVPAAVLTKSMPVSVTIVRPVSAAVPEIIISRLRHAHSHNIKSNSTIRRHKTRNQLLKTSNSSSRVTAAKALVVNVVKGMKGKWVWRPKYPILDHDSRTTGNMSYLSDFQELNGGYIAFGGNPKGGKISGKEKIKTDFKLPNESQVLLIVPRENNMYNVNLKDIVPYGDLTCLFAKATIDESRVPRENNMYNVNLKDIIPYGDLTCLFAKATIDESNKTSQMLHVLVLRGCLILIVSQGTMNCQPVTAGNQTNPSAGFQETFDVDKAKEEANQQYMLFLVWSTGSSNPQNKEGDAAFDEKEHDAEKPKSAVNLSPSNSALSGEQNDITKKKDKGKSHVEYFTRNRDLNANFKDYSEDSSNDVSSAGLIVPTARQNYSNNTNPISAAGPSNSNISPTNGNSSLRDAYQPPDMLKRENIVYSYHEYVGADADFNNLETSITEELLQFKIQKVWILVDLPHGKRAIGTKWVYRNKKDKRGIVVRNKARLVAQGHIQEEGINYKEVFDLVGRIEAIRLFLAYASFMGFMVYQMDVRRFEDPDHPDKVYKVVKALYGLHQDPRAWYETLANYLLENGFHRGHIDQTLFIKKQKGDILLVQIYVDVIIFGATNNDLGRSFEKLMKDKFQISLMGELIFFLDLQDPDHPDKVYKVVKALYGLHQAPRAWYETLANYLLENGFHRGKIDQTLIKKQKGDILLVQTYVDDIIFGATNKDLCKSFEKLMKDKFQMSLMGELTFFLGL
nr:putative ribonuclease H-like domain-containing protein [Tanacetum cinerariifolium]